MYSSHFHLNLKPFQITTDQRFLYLSEKHKEALAILHYGIMDNRGVLVLTGDVGTGKTLLVHALVGTLGPEVQTAVITDPSLRGLDFFNYMAHAFGMETESKTKGEFLINLGNFLDRLFAANQQALLVIDEAQYLDPVQLEEIRVLSDLERENFKRINVFFVGQSEFNLMLADTRLRALKQRITTHFHIDPLTFKETGLYVRHRLKVAGCDRPLFTTSALKKIFGLTKGYPRLINIICDHCLLSAFVKGLHQVDPAIVKECAADLMHPSQLDVETHSLLENQPRLAITPEADIPPAVAPTTLPAVTTEATKKVEPPERTKPFALRLQTFLRKPACLLAVAVLLPALVWFNFKDEPYPERHASSLSPEFHQESQTKAGVKPIQSSAPNKQLGAPPMKSSQNAPTVKLLVADDSEDVAQPENLLSQESSLSTHHDRPLKSIAEPPVTSETDAPPVLSEEKGGIELVAAELTFTVSTPVEAPGEIKPDQATQSDVVDAPSSSASEIDASTALVDEQPQELSVTPLPVTTLAQPAADELQFQDTESDLRAIIDFVIRKRSQEPGNQ